MGDLIEAIAFRYQADRQKIRGKVIDTLSKQFTIKITDPKEYAGYTRFVFYDEDFTIL